MSRSRQYFIWVASIIALGVVVVAMTAALAPTARPGSTAGETTFPDDATTAPPEVIAEAAEGDLDPPVAEDLIAGLLTAMASDDVTADDLSSIEAVAQGAIVEELRNDQVELETNGWTRSGTAIVESTAVLDVRSDETPVTATVAACIDSHDVQILDDAGDPVSGPPTSPRALNIFTLTVIDAAWKVTARTFPDDPAC